MKKRIKFHFVICGIICVFQIMAGCSSSGPDPDQDLPADPTAPTVISTVPIGSTSDAAPNVTINATFSTSMDPATIIPANFTVAAGPNPVTGTVTYDATNKTAIFTPGSNLSYSTLYTATVGTGVKDLAGNPLAANKVWTFTTEGVPDTTAPTVTGNFPADMATEVATSTALTAVFSEALSPASIASPASTFSLKETVGAVPVAGSTSLDGPTATFTPGSALVTGTGYTARISTAAEDLFGNPLAAEYTWTFTTAGLRPVMMKSAGDYVVLAMTGVTVGATATIHGDIGINAPESSFVGFAQVLDGSGTFSRAASATITGKLFALNYADPTPANIAVAIEDMTAAYADAAGREGGTDLVSGELGGRTLAPGLYYFTAAAAITTDLTLNGGPDDIYIFRIGGALAMAASTHVLLPNGALPKNIYWQTVGAVTVGASSEMAGIILSDAAITLGASVVFNGRLYASSIETLEASISVLEP
jgi:hypothetical protein